MISVPKVETGCQVLEHNAEQEDSDNMCWEHNKLSTTVITGIRRYQRHRGMMGISVLTLGVMGRVWPCR